MSQKLLPQLALLVLVLLCSLQSGMAHEDSQDNTILQNIEANLINLSSVVRSMYGSLIELKAEVKNDINTLREDMNSLNESVSEIQTCLHEHKQHMAGKLDDLQSDYKHHIKYNVDALNQTLFQHQGQLAQLQTSLNSTHSKLDSLTATTAQLSSDHQQIQDISDVECLDTKQSLELHQNLQNNLTHQLKKIKSDVYFIRGPYTCGGTGGWRRVVYLDMSDPCTCTTCPSGWKLTGYSKRTCGRATDGTNTCDSATFPVRVGEYTRICGRIRAYQYASTDGFWSYHLGQVTTIDGAYVDGVSVTHGTPRNHIWTFAAGVSEGNPTRHNVCPCDSNTNIRVPSFVGKDYFCESGINRPWGGSRDYTFHSNDPLWDGEDCLSSSTCCSRRNPPYFVKQLSTSTTDDIEARICLNQVLSDENIAVELVELYVQ